MNLHKTELNVDLPVSYLLEGEGKNLLVLHGYSDNCIGARKRLLGREPLPGFRVLAPNAPFPCPPEREGMYVEGYAWYFRRPDSNLHMISPEAGAALVLQFLRQLGLEREEWVILGFSQGGFFAPHLVRAGLRARKLICVGSGFRADSYRDLPKDTRVFGLHGDADEIVPLEPARKSFGALEEMGLGAQFHVMPGVGHRVDDAGRAVIRGWLSAEGVR